MHDWTFQFGAFEKLANECFSKLREQPYYYLLPIFMKKLHASLASITPAYSNTTFKHRFHSLLANVFSLYASWTKTCCIRIRFSIESVQKVFKSENLHCWYLPPCWISCLVSRLFYCFLNLHRNLYWSAISTIIALLLADQKCVIFSCILLAL